MTGFVFAAKVPNLPPGPVSLRLRVKTASGINEHKLPLSLPLPEKPVVPEPVRAMIETARIDERGVLHAVGWAVSLSPLESVQVFLGARLVGEVQRGLRRDDVAHMLPEYSTASTAGFTLQREVTDADLRIDQLRLLIAAAGGVRRAFFAPLEVATQGPRPAPETLAKAACEELRLTQDGILAVKGWAIASSGVAAIQIWLGDVEVATTTPSEERPDVGNSYPRVAGAGLSGFRLQRRLHGRHEGEHTLRITVRGRQGEEHTTTQRVTALPPTSPGTAPGAEPMETAPTTEAIRFHLDAPACKDGVAINPVRGFLALNGWAFSRDGIDRVEVFVDGVSQGRAYHGIRREDLQKSFPGEDVALSGFAMILPPQVMKKGEHAVRVEVTDKAGRSQETRFTVLADPASDGPGPWTLRTKLPQAEIDVQHAILAAQNAAPHWTLLLPVMSPTPAALVALSETLERLCWQAYEHWSLIVLANESAPIAAVIPPELRARVELRAPDAAGVLAALARPDGFLAVLSPGDRLGEDALLELSVEHALAPNADFIYSDERRIDPADGEERAFFKPDFSPDLLLSTNYIGRLWAASAPLLHKLALRQADLAERGEYDAILRLTEQAAAVLHVAKVLCARGRQAESRALERAALTRAVRRQGIAGTLLAGPVAGTWRLRRDIVGTPLISIIIPTAASRDLIKTAIQSIRAHTAWPAYEIIVLNNIPADGTAEQRDCKIWIAQHADRSVQVTEKFNWSRLNNRGARAAKGTYLLFLNDDIEVTDPHWLHGLMEHAQRPEVAVVGPQLLYPDGRVQHAGVFLARAAGRHAFRFYPADAPGPFGLARTQRNVISVTGACYMVRRQVFDDLGGFNEAHAIVNNDLDFSLRAQAAGLRVIYNPAVSLIHHEMVSRAGLADAHDKTRFLADWGDVFAKGDPYFNRHLSVDYDDYQPEAEPLRQFTPGHPLFARDKIRRILLVKLDHIGDFIIAFPAIQRLRAAFPQAEITVLAAKASLALAALEPAIDRVLEFNFYHARSEKGRLPTSKKDLADLRARLAPERFDLAIDLRRQPDTRPILQASGARWLAGFDRGYAYPWLDIALEFEGDIALNWKRAHAGDSLLGLIDAVVSQCGADRRVVRTQPGAVAEGRAMLGRLLGAELGAGALMALHTGAGAVNKQWPSRSFAALIDLLSGEAGATVVIIGGDDEYAFVQGMMKHVRRRDSVRSLVGKVGLRDVPAVLRAMDVYIGNDSGPKHIAAALGVPTIGIHSGSVDAGEWGALGPFGLTLRRDMTCSPCYLAHAKDCPRGLLCLDGIAVGDVYRAARRLLALRAPASAQRLEAAAE
jgi:ADP-heptose:LPS heptosyltransferase/GT2 family glycosyltransferase